MKNKFILLAVALLVFSVVMRLLPHAPNFTPIASLALFAGVYFPRGWGFLVPIMAMLAGDVFIGFYDLRLMAVVYGSFSVMVALGWLVRKNKNFGTIFLGILGGSVFFFLATNAAVWVLSSWYPQTLGGLLLSYTTALPFFRNSLLGGLAYSGLFFGVYEFFYAFLQQKKLIFKPLTKSI